MLQRLARFSSIVRPLDITYPTNLAILLLMFLLAIGVTLYRYLFDVDQWFLDESIRDGINTFFVVFLAWALTRELDPDHPLSAFVAVAIVLWGFFSFGVPTYIALFFMLLAIRIINRSVGLPATLLDSLIVGGLGIYLLVNESWLYLIPLGIAYLLDAILWEGRLSQLVFAWFALAATIIWFVLGNDLGSLQIPTQDWVSFITVVAGLFMVVVVLTRRVRSVADATSEPLILTRLQGAQILALLTCIIIALTHGNDGIIALFPLWGAFVATVIYRVYAILISPLRLERL